MVADADARAIAIMADAEEREKRLAMELLSVRAIETELAQRAKCEGKQAEDLAGVMRLRWEELREVKRVVDGIAVEMAEVRASLPVLVPVAPRRQSAAAPEIKRAAPSAAPAQAAPARPGRATPEAMEGVVVTVPAPANTPWDDPIEDWEDMEGVEPEGLYTSHHAPELGAPTGATLDAPKRKKEKGKAKEVQVAVPPAATPTPGRKPKDPPASSKGRRWWKGR